MILLFVWGFVACYFFVLWLAVGFEMAVGGSILFVFFALKFTVSALLPLAAALRDRQPEPLLPANLDQPPQR